MKLWKRPIVAAVMRLNRSFWRDVHEDTCRARFCGGWRCCSCFRPPEYVTDERWRVPRR
jgi:hypothetical protein